MDILKDGIVKTRKDHRCHGCNQIIPKGTSVYSQTNVDDGIYTLYTCDKCRNWCKERKCENCIDSEIADERYIRECMKDNGEAV